MGRRINKNGAKLLIGGKKINNVAYDKTILLNPSHDDMVSRNEIFGPVACIYTYDKFESAIEIANSVNVSNLLFLLIMLMNFKILKTANDGRFS